MSKLAFVAAACTCLLAALPASANNLRPQEVTADGTWDCKDPGGAPTTTIVVADKTYALLKTDGRSGGYGTLFWIDHAPYLPVFGVISGPLRDELKSQGLSMRGPRDNPFDFSGPRVLNVVMSTDGSGKLDWDCMRR